METILPADDYPRDGTSHEPEVDKGATIYIGSDQYPATVTSIQSNRGLVVTLREDLAVRIDENGMSDCQRYVYRSNPHGEIYHFKKDGKGRWRECRINDLTGNFAIRNGGIHVSFGHRGKYHDYSF